MNETSDGWLTVDEACDYLRVTRRTLERYRADGLVTAYRLASASVRFRRADLEVMLTPIPPGEGEE